MAHCVWALEDDDLVEMMMQCKEPNAKCLIFSLMESIPHEDFIKILLTLWAIWHARRKAIHEHVYQGPYATNQFVKNYQR